MNKIAKFFYFLYRKIIGEDIETVRYIYKQQKEGKPILDPEKKRIFVQEMKKAPKEILTHSWPWLLAIIFTFSMGYIVGLEKCQIECNNFIYREYGDRILNDYGIISNDSEIMFPSISKPPSEISQEGREENNKSKDSIVNPLG